MTIEEMEFWLKHPEIPEFVVPAFLADLKRGRALREAARQAAERGVVTRAIKLAE